MDNCIAEVGCTYIGGGGPPRGGAQEALEGGSAPGSPPLTLTLQECTGPNTRGHAGPTWVLCTEAKIQF
jgi:hypothetical protein